jgi:aryl-alcohol dehydrogenase-like predicted oxidoreductase
MQYVRLGASGLEVSRICLGCMSFGSPGVGPQPWALGRDAAAPILKAAIDAGINFFDTANVYSYGASEEITGSLLREYLPRDRYVVATKVGLAMAKSPGPHQAGLSRKHIMDEIDASLRRLNTDYVDLFIVHRFDPNVPIEETMEALNDVVRAGKARYLGASTMYAYQFVQLHESARRNGWPRFISMQNFYNLAWREEEVQMNRYCIDNGVGLTPWSPLGYGFLASDWRDTKRQDSARGRAALVSERAVVNLFGSPDDFKVVDALKAVAAEIGKPMAQVAIAWLLGRPGVAAPVLGATAVRHVDDAVGALSFTLLPDHLERLDSAYSWVRSLGFHN